MQPVGPSRSFPSIFVDPYDSDVSKDNNFGFSEQGMKDLDEVGGFSFGN